MNFLDFLNFKSLFWFGNLDIFLNLFVSKFWSLIIGMVSFLGGVLLASFGLWWMLIALCVVLGGLFCVGRISASPEKRFQFSWRYLLIIFVALGFGYLRFAWALPHFTVRDLGFYRDLNVNVKFEGFISNEIQVQGDKQSFAVTTSKLFWNNNWREIQGKILVKTDRFPEFHFGDYLQIQGQIRSPPSFEGSFYPQQLAEQDIYAAIYVPKIQFLHAGTGDPFWQLVFTLKSWLSNQINVIFTEPEASLVAGLLMGIRTSIPQSILDDFNRAGLTHVLAISGYNINLMITIFGFFFVGAGRRARFLGMLCGIVLFLLFTGFSGSVIRAAWMGFFVILSIANGRKGQAIINLLLSAFLMTFLNPYVLAFDLSFELSFLATLGLVLLMPVVEKYFEARMGALRNETGNVGGSVFIKLYAKMPEFLREGLLITLAAQVFTTPLILYYFGRFSIIAPIANILFLPMIPLIMLVSFLALIISFVSPLLAFPFVAMTWIFLKILLNGVHFIAAFWFASVQI